MFEITWLLGFLPDWIWSLLLIIGVTAVLASWAFTFIPVVSTYRLPIQVAGTVAIVISVWFLGAVANEQKWQARIKELEDKVANAELASKEKNTKIQIRVVKQTEIIKERGQDIIEYIDREVVKYDNTCPIPKEAIKALNDAAEVPKQ
jgi:translation elongation factor EF-Tu-like GTPase